MTKQSGLGDNFYIAGYDLSGDIGSLENISCPMGTFEKTGIDKSAYERIGSLHDGSMEWMAYFNPAAGQAHDRFSLLPTVNVITTYCRGTAIGKPAACMTAKQINYDGTRGSDGDLTFKVNAQSANGVPLEWGTQLTAGKITHASATAGTAVDFTSATAFGLQAYLHVFSVGSGTCTVAIQESSDNGADAYANVVGGVFTAATGITSQRIATATNLAVERYLKVTTTGVFTNAVFSVVVIRNLTAVLW